MALPPGLETAAAAGGVGGGWANEVTCVVRDGDSAKMGDCEEQMRIILQVRSGGSIGGGVLLGVFDGDG